MPYRRRRWPVVFLYIVSCLLPALCLAPGVQQGYAETETEEESKPPLDIQDFLSKARGSWTIDAAQITYDAERKVYEATGSVKISSGDRVIQADWAELDAVNRRAELRGNVFLQFRKDWLRGERVSWNLDEETGEVDNGLAYFAANHLYTRAEHLAKTGPTQYDVKKGELTSCDPQNPDWKIRYGSLKVDTEGTGWARGTSFWVKSFPLLYSPIVLVPFQRQRQSGFLLPWGGYSELNGFQGELPFYWAIRQDMDATFFGRVMEKRGFMGGVEFRINNDWLGEGIYLANYLKDFVDEAHLADNGYSFETDDRYWIRSRHSFELPHEIVGRLDLDLASDRNFFREFTSGSSSTSYTDRIFREGFGRGLLQDENALIRESSLYMERPFESSVLSMDARYWDQLESDLVDSTMEKLPSFAYTILPTGIGELPLYYGLESSLVNYYRLEGDHGSRLYASPQLYLPWQWKSYLSTETSAAVRASSYWVDWERDNGDALEGRAWTDVHLGVSSRLNRVYSMKIGDAVAFQHAVRPEVSYDYVSEPLEGNVPLFDRLDSNPAKNRVEYGISTFLTSKSVTRNQDGEETPSYLELARLRVFHGYNFEKTSEGLSGLLLDTISDQGWTDVGMRLDLTPKKFLTLSYDLDVSVDEGRASAHDVYMILRSGRGDLFRLDYQYRTESVIDELITQLNLAITSNLYFITYHDYSFDQQEMFAQGYGFRYDHGCWAFGVAYENKDNDHRVAVTLNLLGLGSIGSSRTYTATVD